MWNLTLQKICSIDWVRKFTLLMGDCPITGIYFSCCHPYLVKNWSLLSSEAHPCLLGYNIFRLIWTFLAFSEFRLLLRSPIALAGGNICDCTKKDLAPFLCHFCPKLNEYSKSHHEETSNKNWELFHKRPVQFKLSTSVKLTRGCRNVSDERRVRRHENTYRHDFGLDLNWDPYKRSLKTIWGTPDKLNRGMD